MSIVLKRQVIYQILFFACVAIPYLSSYEATFALWSLTAMVTLQKKYSITILHYVGCFVAIFLIALIVGSFHDTTAYDFLRDIAYLLKPILGLLVGYHLCKDYLKNPMGLIVYSGLIIAFLHLIVIGHSVLIIRVKTMNKLREYSGYFSDFEVYAIIILLFRRKFNFHIPQKWFLPAVALLSISIFFYLARTNFIQFGVFFLALLGYFALNRRSVTIMASLVLVGLVSYAAIYYYNPARNAKGFEAFLYKVKNAPIEPFKTKVSADNWKDFNDNYRSYENILTLRQVPSKGVGAVIYGEGMGSSIDLKRRVWLQTSYMRYIPFLHNGFMTVFLKSGLLGDLILIYTIIFLCRAAPTDNRRLKVINNLLLGTGIYLIISYWVFMGFYFVPDTKAVVVGFLLRYRENIIREEESVV